MPSQPAQEWSIRFPLVYSVTLSLLLRLEYPMVGNIPTSLRGALAMPNVEKISIALPPEMVAVVRQAVETGEYASSSEVVRDALRDWTQKRSLRQQGIDELRQVWRQAMEDKTPGVPVREVLDRLERKYRKLADAGK